MDDKKYFIKTLQSCYFGDRTAFNELVIIYKKQREIIEEVRKEVKIYEEQSNDSTTNELDNYVFIQRLKNVLDKEDI